MTKKKLEEKEEKYAIDYFIDNMVEKWKANGTVVDEEETRNCILSMCHILSGYKFECALKTLIEVYEEMDNFNWEQYSE
jgi:NAD dependent epimerase/dehydratase family enzyme